MATSKWDEDFDPYKERKPKHALGHIEGCIGVIKGCLGTGLLALPEAFYLAGIYNGIALFILLSLFGTYCFHLNLKSQYLLCKIKKVGYLDYGESLEAAFQVGPKCLTKVAPFAAPFIHFVYVFYQIMSLCTFVIFMGVNLQMVCDQYFFNKPAQTLPMYILYTFPPAVAICLVPNMKSFTPIALFANIVIVATIGVVAYYVSFKLQPWTSLKYVGDYKDFPLFFGTVMFSLLSIPIVLTVERNMRDAAYFVSPFGALNIGFGFCSVLYLIFAIMGYWRYGDQIHSSITLNFPESQALAQVIRALYIVAIWISFGFNSQVPRDVLWFLYINPRITDEKRKKKRIRWGLDYALRFGIVCVIYAIAILLPVLGGFISLTGGLCLSLLGIVLPPVMHICALWPDNLGKHRWILWKNILIFLFGVFAMILTAWASVNKIIQELKK